jgi:cadmium resistance protein CadD (predicted permease)
MITHLGIAIITFVVTNIDDLLLLSVYFASDSYKTRSIVIGQYTGIGILILISLSGMMVGQVVPEKWVHLLGFFPLFLGAKALLALIKGEQDNGSEAQRKSSLQFLSVAFVTIANGGDNIGVYTPLFATVPHAYVLVYVLSFLLLTGVWCLFSYSLVSHELLRRLLARYGKIILPVFLIVLGVFILKDVF